MIITSKDNELIKRITKLNSSSKFRREDGAFAAEGVRLCRDGAESGAEIEMFLFTAQAREKYYDDYKKISEKSKSLYEISEKILKHISDTIAPQGFVCIFKALDKKTLSYKISNQGRYVALENIQDPSNMGTILRTAEALGADGVILSADCCDIYMPKVVRGSMGAVFRVPIVIADDFTRYISKLTKQGIKTYASTPHNAENINDIDFSDGGIILIGNEANGLKEETINICNKRVKIPMKGRAESLNAAAAAAILIWEIQG